MYINFCTKFNAWQYLPYVFTGFHHFYLRNKSLGFLYFFTCGLFGLGWLVDLFRLHSVVRKTNAKHRSGLDKFEDYSLLMAYTFNLFPITGILGGHHFYLGRYFFGVAYFITFGLLGFGWFLDIFRLPVLVRRANEKIHNQKYNCPTLQKVYLDDAYILWFPFGLHGFHHFYLRRYVWGFLYHCTFGLFGIGWLVDMCRIPSLVREYNERLSLTPLIVQETREHRTYPTTMSNPPNNGEYQTPRTGHYPTAPPTTTGPYCGTTGPHPTMTGPYPTAPPVPPIVSTPVYGYSGMHSCVSSSLAKFLWYDMYLHVYVIIYFFRKDKRTRSIWPAKMSRTVQNIL